MMDNKIEMLITSIQASLESAQATLELLTHELGEEKCDHQFLDFTKFGEEPKKICIKCKKEEINGDTISADYPADGT